MMSATRWMPGDLEEIATDHAANATPPDVVAELKARTIDLGHGVGVVPIRLGGSIPPQGVKVGRAIWRDELRRWDVIDDRWSIKSWSRTLQSAERIVIARVKCANRVEASRVR